MILWCGYLSEARYRPIKLRCSLNIWLAQLMPLPLTVSCFSKIQIGFTYLVPAHPGSPGKRAVKRVCVCVCVCVCSFPVFLPIARRRRRSDESSSRLRDLFTSAAGFPRPTDGARSVLAALIEFQRGCRSHEAPVRRVSLRLLRVHLAIIHTASLDQTWL